MGCFGAFWVVLGYFGLFWVFFGLFWVVLGLRVFGEMHLGFALFCVSWAGAPGPGGLVQLGVLGSWRARASSSFSEFHHVSVSLANSSKFSEFQRVPASSSEFS